MQPSIRDSIESSFGHKIRIRSCGILLEEDKILLIKHLGIGELGEFWSPPGGGIESNENFEQALIREFKEETNLTISIKEFGFAIEFIEKPLHAIEFYFYVEKISGDLKLGIEPEIQGISILNEFRWFGIQDLNELDNRKKPKFLRNIKSFEELKNIINFGRY